MSTISATPSFKVTKVSYNGDLETVNQPISELLKSASIFARDLFTLNITSRQERLWSSNRHARRSLSAIEPRDSVIIVSFGNIRAVAGLDHVFLFDTHVPAVRDFAKSLSLAFQNGMYPHDEPFELVFLENVLSDTIESYQRRLRLYEPIVDSLLETVANEVYSDTGVHKLVPMKDSLQSFEIDVKQSLECLTNVINDDDKMLGLLLNEQALAQQTSKEVDFERHEHVELLLGVYARQLSNILVDINYALGRIQSKQEFVAIALSGYRNRMVWMNVHIGIAGLTLGIGTTVAGFFGMNLVNGFETDPFAFNYTILGSGLSGLIVAGSSLNYLSGSAMRKRASQRLKENETLTSALSDLSAVDHTIKSTVDKGIEIDRDEFHKLLTETRLSKKASDDEVDLLFSAFDRAKDGYLKSEDFVTPSKSAD